MPVKRARSFSLCPMTRTRRPAPWTRPGSPIAPATVLIVRVLDEPGTLGDVAVVMSQAGINIDSVYVTTRGYVVLGVDDLVGATQVAGGMAVMTPE